MGGDWPCSPPRGMLRQEPPGGPVRWSGESSGFAGSRPRGGGGLRCPQKPGGPGPGEGQTSGWGLGGSAAGITGWGLQEVRASLLGLQSLLSGNLRAQASVLLESSLPSSLFVAPPRPISRPPPPPPAFCPEPSVNLTLGLLGIQRPMLGHLFTLSTC